ncbi:hypothetical protein BC938DRAFT_476963 [Jimgerdemannia flammicorona]|uniref:Uncharacterized protein n=1 Tax=Jimgerdemannia flammicorona TaxID=994334 RepID=A0A433PD27_9FUNG|nr:hypothetical protein BC938DRAFT_476963 [Jimgerdemannia flammicorona]
MPQEAADVRAPSEARLPHLQDQLHQGDLGRPVLAASAGASAGPARLQRRRCRDSQRGPFCHHGARCGVRPGRAAAGKRGPDTQGGDPAAREDRRWRHD